MSDLGIALISAGSALVGVIIPLVYILLDNRQRFRVMTFEKRLQASQEALSYCYRLYHSLSSNKLEEERGKIINEMENWWESNCLALDEKSQRKMLNLVGDARDHIYGEAESQNAIYKTLRETLRVIVKGIGTKHLPEIRNLKEEEKTFQG